MRVKLPEQEFQKVYSRYLDGLDPYQLAEMYWQEYGFASMESFRISFIGRCHRKGLPMRDPASSRRRRQTRPPVDTSIQLTPEERRALKLEIDARRREVAKRTRRLEMQYE